MLPLILLSIKKKVFLLVHSLLRIEFEEEKIQVAGIITETDIKSLELGMEMETTTLRLFTNDEKQEVVTWAFQAVK